MPHGYLSDDEGLEGDHVNQQDKGSLAKDQPKRRALEPLVPVIVGLFFRQKDSEKSLQVGSNVLIASPVTLLGGRLAADPMEVFESGAGGGDAATEDQRKSVRKSVFPEELSQALMLDISGKSTGIPKLVDDFKASHPQLTKTAIEAKIKEIAVKEKRGTDLKALWYPRGANVVLC